MSKHNKGLSKILADSTATLALQVTNPEKAALIKTKVKKKTQQLETEAKMSDQITDLMIVKMWSNLATELSEMEGIPEPLRDTAIAKCQLRTQEVGTAPKTKTKTE